MLRRVRRYQHARCQVLVVKYEGDTRYSGASALSTHDRVELPAVSTRELLPMLTDPLYRSSHVIAVDEGQFFPDLPEFCSAALASGKTVVRGGPPPPRHSGVFLTNTHRRHPTPHTHTPTQPPQVPSRRGIPLLFHWHPGPSPPLAGHPGEWTRGTRGRGHGPPLQWHP